jgi:predicted Ser/Thr protein kinase
MPVCSSCSRDVPTGSRFCPSCGATVEPEEAEKRDSTILGDSSMLSGDEPYDEIEHGSFLPGTIIAQRYRIVALLGKGGMGEVYRADDLKLGQSVALKFLPTDLAKDPQRRQRFHNEVRIARQVAHPNVCRVYDIGEVEGHTYLSMEYVDGEDLSSLLRRIGRVPHDKAVEIARQMCVGLAAAHERGILHRDFKPANVMIDGRGKARITDFGLAALADEVAGASSRAGTPPYMSPEQFTGEEFTVRSDIYSLGLALYELFTGKPAFEADSISDYTHLHTKVAPVSPANLVTELEPTVERAILHCLEKNPELRPSSALEVAAALPGGDPLAAALAAGETPSPDLVAATTPAEGVPLNVSVACLLVILLGIAAFPFINDLVKLHTFVALDKPPAVLVDRAREIIDKLGYGRRATDSAYGFEVNDEYLDYIESRDNRPTRWSRLTAGRPAAIALWYRQSPTDLVPDDVLGIVTPRDPPPIEPQMIEVKLDPQGRLLDFEAVPPRLDTGMTASAEPNWSLLFREARLDRTRFERVLPTHVPPMYCDSRAAWVGRTAENPEIPMRVEAAAYRGKVVFLKLFPDSSDSAADGTAGLTALQAGRLINVALVLVCLAGAAALARRNLALGRGDRRGAFRVSALVGGALMGAWALQANHVPEAIAELRLLAVAAGRSLVSAAICWLLYVALEPYVRQRWPDMLISWNRFLANRFRDPVIGRDILIGGLFGILAVLLTAVLYFGPGWLGSPPPRPVAVPNLAFLGLRYQLAQLLQIVTKAVLEPMAVLLLLLLLLVLVRKRPIAIIALFVILTVISSLITLQPGGNVYLNTGVHAMLSAALIFVLMRFGLLAVIIAVFYMLLLDAYPITANLQAWYVDGSYFALLVAAGLALYGFYISLAGRGLWNRKALLH